MESSVIMPKKIGLWLIGAHGGVATTVAVGLTALKQQQTDAYGLVSCLPEFRGLDFVDWNSIVIGGHEIRQSSAADEAATLSSGVRGTPPAIDPRLVASSRIALNEYDQSIRPGILIHAGPAIERLAKPAFLAPVGNGRAAVETVQTDLLAFKAAHGCDDVVVINVASTEPSVATGSAPATWDLFETLLDEANCRLPSSTLYAIAAIDLGMPYVNFTPSRANDFPAIFDLALRRKTCHMGHDGKTGETFIKSVLAPAFANRNLEVMSWVGHNIFGNMDGQVLDDPANKQTKVSSKNRMLAEILGYEPQSHISIEYIRSLGDWKTAWDHIHFRGFLGTAMTMQFTWQGCDSILAAPLVLDLLRFAELAHRRGETGLLTFLASFFKSPLGSVGHDFARQFQLLTDWAANRTDG